MDSLRELSSANCGQQSALSQLTTNINPSILQDASVYKNNAQLPPMTMPNLNNPLQPMTAHQLENDFAKHKPNITSLPIPMHQQPMLQPQVKPEQNVHALYKNFQQLNVNPNNMFNNNNNAPMMYAPPMPMMNTMPMYPMQQRPLVQPIIQQQQQPQQRNDSDTKVNDDIQKDEINTNGTEEMKNMQEVADEYSQPPVDDQDQKVHEHEHTNNNMALQLENQFKDWIDPSVVDSMDWQSYMKALDPGEQKDPVYEFADDNPYLQEQQQEQEQDEQVEKKDHFAEGKRLMNSGLLNEAILAFEACVKQEQNRSEAWRYLGVCHADNENDTSAIAAYLKCHQLDPYDLDALLQLGVSYTNEIDPLRAITYLRNWIGNHTDYGLLAEQEVEPEQRKMMGGWMGAKAEQARIIQLFGRALEINGKDPDLHIVMGVLYNLTSEFRKAEMHFKRALQARPDDPSLWNKLGATQANGGECKAAIKAYSRALRLKPNYVRVLSNLGISFANQHMHKEACQSYLASLKLNTNADGVWDHLSMSLMHLNRSDLVELCKRRDVNDFKNHFDF